MRFAVLAGGLLLAACGQPQQAGWPAGAEMNFMRACEARSTVAGLCGCTWEQIEANIDPADFVALERLPGPEREAHALTQQISGYAEACHAQLLPAAMEPEAKP